jgi:RimJ/RimL family protein N-acetyltransferase
MEFRQMTDEDLAYHQKHALNPDDRKIHVGESEYTYSLVDGDVVLGIAGFKFINDTTAWCWLSMGENAKEHLTISFRTLAEWIPTFCRDFKIRRLEAYVKVGFEAGVRLVEHLGFTEESRMPNFFDDMPGIRFVRFFKESK